MLRPGVVLGDYRLGPQLGRGATGLVFEADDLVRKRRVAIKTCGDVGDDRFYQLKREFRIASGLSHPNLVALHELVLDGPVPFFAMELIDGRPLTDFLRQSHDSIAAVRSMLPGLISALERLHAAGIVHGDLKPQNVMVAGGPRPTLLDFGFARAGRPRVGALDTYGLTPAYAAPERLRGAPATESSDWYSLGAVLFEALTGEVPFTGTPTELYESKVLGAPPFPRRDPSWPDDLCDFITRLLEPRSSSRRAERQRPNASPPHEIEQASNALINDVTSGAIRLWRSGECVRLWVNGTTRSRSSAILRTVDAHVRATVPDAWVLHGSCWRDEVVTRNAFDGVADQLASMLVTLPNDELSNLVGTTAADVAVIFPMFSAVARRVRAVAADVPDAARCTTAFRDMLVAIARSRPLCLAIDDAHRGDADSARLFLDLFGSSPVPPLLLVAAMSPEGAKSSEMWEVIQRSGGLHWLRGRDIHMVDESMDGPRVELPHHAEHAQIIADVGEAMDALTAFGRPLRQATLARTLRAPLTATVLLEAREAKLLDFQRLHPDVPIELGEGVSAPKARDSVDLQDIHRRLALALEHDPREAVAAARHWREAGEVARAAMYALTAAKHAEATLASVRASSLFALALEWDGWDADRRTELRLALARSLCASGRLAEAASIEAEVARERPSDLDLPRQAAEHYLTAGLHAEGMALLEPLLAQAGLPFATSVPANLLGILADMASLRFRPAGRPAVADRATEEAVDLCWSATRGLIATDFVRGAFFALRGLRLALVAGTASQRARAMAVVGAAVLGPLGGRIGAWGHEWLARARTLASDLGDSHLLGTISVLTGQLRLVRGELAAAFDESVRGQSLLRTHSGDVAFERNVGRMGALRAAEDLGRYDYLRSRAYRYLREARESGDRYAALTFAFSASFAALLADDATAAERVLKEAQRDWSVRGFHIQHLYIARSLAAIALYRGEPDTARDIVDAMWPDLERSQLLRVPVALIDATWIRARARLGSASGRRDTDAVERDVASLASVNRPGARGLAALLDGGLRELRGDSGGAVTSLRAASSAFVETGMVGLGLAARFRCARLLGDSQAAEAARFDLSALGVARVDRWLAAFAPGGGAS